jgi:ferric hydroxamate transport system substrate-binding protein
MTANPRTARLRAATAPARLALALAALAAALALAACGSGDDGGGGESGSSGGGAGPVAITDDTGKRVELDRPARRVVAIEWEAAENVLALGVDPVGVGDREIYRDWVAAGEDLPESTKSVGTRGEASLERIAALEPDLIVAGRDGVAGSRAKMERIAPVAVFDIAPKPGDDATEWERMRAEVERLGVLLDRRDEATGLLARLDRTLAEQAERVEKAGAKGDTVAIVQAFTAGKPSARLFDDGAQLVEVARRLGLRNAFEGKRQQWGITPAGLEGLRRVGGADWMLTLALPDDDPFKETWSKNAAYKRLPVVQRDRVIPLGGDTWTWGGPLSAALAARRIADAVTGEAEPYS